MPGPAPKPTALKRLQGNPGKRRLNQAEPKPRAERMYAPRWLDADAKGAWRAIAPKLQRLGLLTEVDGPTLEAWCALYARWRQAENALKAGGLTYETATGFVRPRPEISIATNTLKELRLLTAEFGMTPASRSRISIAPPDTADPFEEYLVQSRVTEALDE
jgi:P27 family predicted phage terminase small subunit